MRTIPFLLLLALAVACTTTTTTTNPGAENNTAFAAFEVTRGTNIAHWLSQSNRRGEERAAFFTQEDIRLIDSVGFDHIRLPIDEMQMWDEEGNREVEAFQLLNNALDWCEDAGLRVILDLHILRSHHFNAKEKPLWTDPREQDKFIALWKDLSSEFNGRGTGFLAYELMNEPVADDPEEWNRLISRAYDSVRSWEPERVLIFGSNRWQSADTFDKLRVPANDKNIILSYHFYEPFHLTHFQAGWTDMKDFQGEVNYPGQIVTDGQTPRERRIYNIDTLEKMMSKPLALARQMNLPLYCGEFGVIMGAPVDDKLAWYRDMVEVFERNGIAYANWNYKAGSFGIVDATMKPDEPMITILTRQEAEGE